MNFKFRKYCHLENQSDELKKQVGQEQGSSSIVLAETPHVSVSWPGLDELKSLTNGLGEVTSSSCIPSVSTVGQCSLRALIIV